MNPEVGLLHHTVILFLNLFWEKVSLCSPDWASCFSLPSDGITGMYYHALLELIFTYGGT
jgi:hypothetical protein